MLRIRFVLEATYQQAHAYRCAEVMVQRDHGRKETFTGWSPQARVERLALAMWILWKRGCNGVVGGPKTEKRSKEVQMIEGVVNSRRGANRSDRCARSKHLVGLFKALKDFNWHRTQIASFGTPLQGVELVISGDSQELSDGIAMKLARAFGLESLAEFQSQLADEAAILLTEKPSHGSFPGDPISGLTSAKGVSLAETSKAAQHAGDDLARATGRVTILDLADMLGLGENETILKTSSMLGYSLEAIGGYIMLWHCRYANGLGPDDIKVEPQWDPLALACEGGPGEPLEPLPAHLLAAICPYLVPDNPNKSKVWLKSYADPLTDRRVTFTVGGTNWDQAGALRRSYQSPLLYNGKKYSGLTDVYNQHILDIRDQIYGMVVIAVAILTADGYLALGNRNTQTIAGANGAYSPSAEEGWHPHQECTPTETVIRCLEEEWALKKNHGIHLEPEKIKLMSIGREWDPFWHCNLIYVAKVPCNAHDLIRLQRRAEDRDEHRAVCCVPLKEPSNRAALLRASKRGLFRPSDYVNTVWGGKGRPVNAPLHQTTGPLRILYALAHFMGIDSLAADVVRLKQSDESQ
jgi:hypothetical protein